MSQIVNLVAKASYGFDAHPPDQFLKRKVNLRRDVGISKDLVTQK